MIADLSVNHVERQALLCGATVERIVHDYGNDITVFSFDNGYWEPSEIRFQLKATERIQALKDNTVVVRVQRSNLVHWLRERVPVIILSPYDVDLDKAYWVDIKAYFRTITAFNIFAAGATVSVRLPMARALDPDIMRELIAAKNEALLGD